MTCEGDEAEQNLVMESEREKILQNGSFNYPHSHPQTPSWSDSTLANMKTPQRTHFFNRSQAFLVKLFIQTSIMEEETPS